MNYQTFKNEMLNYKRYKESVQRLNDEYENIVYQMTGVKGIRYDKTHSSFNLSFTEEMRFRLSNKLSEKETEIDHTLLAIKNIENKLNKLPKDIREMCLLLFVENQTFYYVGKLYGYSDHGIYEKVKREVEKI